MFDGITAFPNMISYGLVAREQRELVRTLTLWSLRKPSLVLDEVRCDEPALRLEPLEREFEGKVTLRAYLRPKKLKNADALDATIHIRAKGGGHITIPVIAKCISEQ